MFESKYSKVLTIILVIVIVAIVGLLGFLGYDYYQNYMVTKDTSDFVDNFQGEIEDGYTTDEGNNSVEGDGSNPFDEIKSAEGNTSSSGSNNKRPTYKGFGVLGTIEIPATSLKYPVLEKVTKSSIEAAVARLYPSSGELNEPYNTVIIGHNYRNGLFFSNNKKLNVGDKIYITDNNGNKMTYTIYNKFETTPEDTTFYQRDTGGVPEITLSTCTDDSSARLILFAKAE